jgi:hypothetical protein
MVLAIAYFRDESIPDILGISCAPAYDVRGKRLC